MVPKLQQLGILFLSIEKRYSTNEPYAFGKADGGSFDTAFMELYFMKKNIQLLITSDFLSQLYATLIAISQNSRNVILTQGFPSQESGKSRWLGLFETW